MIVHLTVGGQPIRLVVPRPNAAPENRATLAARYAVNQTVIMIRREWQRAGRKVVPAQTETPRLVRVCAVYCCATCERKGDALSFVNPAPTAVPRTGAAQR